MDNLENIIRPVSVYEQNLESSGIIVSRNRLQGMINLTVFTKALEIIKQRHMFLNCTFYKQGNTVYFKKHDDLILPLTIKYNIIDKKEKDDLYRNELNIILNPYERLWHVLLILECQEEKMNKNSFFELIIAVHHCICDANSLLNLVKEILEQTEAIQNQKPLYENKRLPVIPPADKYFSDYLQNPDLNDFTSNVKSTNLYKMDIDFSIPEDQCTINYLEDFFSKEVTLRLINRSREEEITVYGIFCASMLKAIINTIGIDLKTQYSFQLYCPVNPRKRIPFSPGNNPLFCYAFGENIIISIDNNTSILQTAKQILGKLNDNIIKAVGIKEILKKTYNNEITIKSNKKKNQKILGITNVGKSDIPPDYGDFRLYSTNFTASGKFANIVIAITTFNDCLNYIFLFSEPWFNTDFVKAINKEFQKHIFHFIKMFREG